MNNFVSSPNISLATSNFAITTSWFYSKILGSDRSAITVEITCEIQTVKASKTYMNLKEANWKIFQSESEKAFRKKNTTAQISHGRRESFSEI